MKFTKFFYLVSIVLFSAVTEAKSDAVAACATDSYAQEQILEIPANERVDVRNKKADVVGAIHFDPATGDLISLYLCGANSGYYYMNGNLYQHKIESIYNDEYDSQLDVSSEDDVIQINLLAVYFSGDPDDADYSAFGAAIFVRVPQK